MELLSIAPFGEVDYLGFGYPILAVCLFVANIEIFEKDRHWSSLGRAE